MAEPPAKRSKAVRSTAAALHHRRRTAAAEGAALDQLRAAATAGDAAAIRRLHPTVDLAAAQAEQITVIGLLAHTNGQSPFGHSLWPLVMT